MKKVIIIAMLLSLICVCGLSAGVCFADETFTYYYVKEGKELTMYSSPQRQSGSIIMQIPSTYAFRYVKEENSEFVEIEYNTCKGYILVNDLNDCIQVTSKWGANPYSYVFDINNFKDFSVANFTDYYYDETTKAWTESANPTPASLTVVKEVYGYYKDGNGQSYFLVDFDVNILGVVHVYKHYIKATDFDPSVADIKNIPASAGFIAQNTPDKPPTSDGEITSGDSNSSVDNPTNTQAPKNSLDRYILIAVIAVLCVVIMILIFVPNKKRQN